MSIWVFKGPKRYPGFASAVFSDLALAEEWVRRHSATGTCTLYPVDIGVYEWAIGNGFFKPKKPEHTEAEFIESFSSAHQEHMHYEAGKGPEGSLTQRAAKLAENGIATQLDALSVWVFKGPRLYPGFPSAVFSDLLLGEEWVSRHSATGTLTLYPVDTGVYEWAIKNGFFRPRRHEHTEAGFIESFSSAHQEHYHYCKGQLAAG